MATWSGSTTTGGLPRGGDRVRRHPAGVAQLSTGAVRPGGAGRDRLARQAWQSQRAHPRQGHVQSGQGPTAHSLLVEIESMRHATAGDRPCPARNRGEKPCHCPERSDRHRWCQRHRLGRRQRLADEGMRVVVTDIDADLVAERRRSLGRPIGMAADVSDEDAVDRWWRRGGGRSDPGSDQLCRHVG